MICDADILRRNLWKLCLIHDGDEDKRPFTMSIHLPACILCPTKSDFLSRALAHIIIWSYEL